MNLQYSTLTLEISQLRLRAFGIKSIFVTNGYESKEVVVDMPNIIDGANIDLKSFNAEYYRRELGADLNRVSGDHKAI